MMDISTIIFAASHIQLMTGEDKIPWNEPAFSERMLENHLSQEHDWASRRLHIIEQQIDWIDRQLPGKANILDLGCGPGLYTRLLAERGHRCTGVDFSPASIAWARQQAQITGLDILYVQEDLRAYRPENLYDFIMMTFGELNVFSASDCRTLIKQCAQWLVPGGTMLAEVHTFDEVKRQGMVPASWQRCPQGLFLSAPHLLLTENYWDEESHTTSTQFWAIEKGGHVTRFGSQMKAWHEDEFVSLFNEAGLTAYDRPDSSVWPVSETFEGKLFTLMAKKTTDESTVSKKLIKGIK